MITLVEIVILALFIVGLAAGFTNSEGARGAIEEARDQDLVILGMTGEPLLRTFFSGP